MNQLIVIVESHGSTYRLSALNPAHIVAVYDTEKGLAEIKLSDGRLLETIHPTGELLRTLPHLVAPTAVKIYQGVLKAN